MLSEMKNEEAPEEQVSTNKETVLKLRCHIDHDNNPVD